MKIKARFADDGHATADVVAVNRATAGVQNEIRSHDDQDTIAVLQRLARYLPVSDPTDGAGGRLADVLASHMVDVAGTTAPALDHPEVNDTCCDCLGQDWPRELNLDPLVRVVRAEDDSGILCHVSGGVRPVDSSDGDKGVLADHPPHIVVNPLCCQRLFLFEAVDSVQ